MKCHCPELVKIKKELAHEKARVAELEAELAGWRGNPMAQKYAALVAGINAIVESVDALNDGGWTDLIAGAFDKISRDLRALTDPSKNNEEE